MLKSMTGYGRGRNEINGKEFTVEIKSVNHKYHDINVKIPKSISYLEEYIKKRINENITRGKIDVYVNYINFSNANKEVKIDEELTSNYITKLNELSNKYNIKNNISIMDIIQLPEVITVVDKQDEDEIKNDFSVTLNEALLNFINMRKIEGEKITNDLSERIDIIYKNIIKISELSTGLVDEYIVKLKQRIKEILKNDIIDENRLALEAVIYADKTSIEEEITRLKSHISQFKTMLQEDKANGKKLDFLVQEMNREINTIASKANCLEITKQVVEIKNELENIREQVQNIE